MSQGFTQNLPVPLPVSRGGTGLTSTKAVIQRVYTSTGAVATGTTLIPQDDTIPQNTEGTEYLTLAITPKNTANILVINAFFNVTCSVASSPAIALFQDSTASALAARAVTVPTANFLVPLSITHTMVAGTTSATTFKIRIGQESAGTLTVNGQVGARKYGGVFLSTLEITEYAP